MLKRYLYTTGAAALALAAAASCSTGAALDGDASRTLDAAAVANMHFLPWDLAYIYPLGLDRSEMPTYLSLRDLGYSDAQFKAMVAHVSQEFLIPEAKSHDDKLSDVVAGKKTLGGLLNDRLAHQSTDPATPVSILDDAGADASACYHDMNAWRAVQVRIAPYKIQPPGTPSAYLAWATAHGKKLDRIIQMRISFRPFCGSGPRLAPLDQVMHFAFELRPDDAAVASAVWDTANVFQNKARAHDDAGAKDALLKHVAGLEAPAYLAFRRSVLADVAKLAALRGTTVTTAFAPMDGVIGRLRDGLALDRVATDHTGNVGASLAHPGLTAPGPLRDAVKAFAQKYATQRNVTAIASMVTENGSRWTFANFGLGRYGQVGALSGDAAAAYSLIHPNAMSTTAAMPSGDALRLFPLMTGDLYANALVRGGFQVLDKTTPLIKALAGEVDFYALESLVTVDPTHQTVAYTPEFPTEGKALRDEAAKYASPSRTVPSSTSCNLCHILPRLQLDPTAADGVRLARSTNIHLLNERSITARSVQELDREFPKLNLEWRGLSESLVCDAKALQACLTAKDDDACLVANCH